MKKSNVLLVALLVLAAHSAFARDEFDEIVSHTTCATTMVFSWRLQVWW